jgi:hypothetical protein
MKKLLFILPILAALLFYGLQNATTKELQKQDISQLLKAKLDKKTLEQNINKAIKKRDFSLAQSYIELAKKLQITIDPTLQKRLKSQSSSISEYIHKGEDFFKGFISGKSSNGASLAGSVASDFSLVGDLRDIYKEGKLYVNNQPYDKFTLSLSMIGVALSATTIASFGASAGAKVGVSILKSAKKSKAITKSFSKLIVNKLDKSVDLKVLKKIDISSIKAIKKSSKVIKKAINPKPIKALLKDINSIKKNTSTIDTIKILKYVDNQKELNRAIKITSRYKKSSLAVFKTLGKGVFRGAKFVIKKSALYLPMLIGLFTTLIFWGLLLLRAIVKVIFR